MKLSTAIIFFQLLKTYSVSISAEPSSELRLKRPVHYSGMDADESVVVINHHDLNLLADNESDYRGALFVCPATKAVAAQIKIPRGAEAILVYGGVSTAQVLNAIQEVFNIYDSWDEELRHNYYESEDFQELINCCDHIICDPITIVDHMFYYIAYSEKMSRERGLVHAFVEENRKALPQMVNASVIDKKFLSLYEPKDVFTIAPIGVMSGDLMIKNLFGRGKYVGRICIKLGSDDAYRKKYNESIIQHVHYYADRLYNKYLSFSKTEDSLSGLRCLLSEYLESDITDNAKWSSTLAEIGWDIDDSLQLIQLRPAMRYDKNMYGRYFCMEIERQWQGSICIEHNECLLLLMNIDKYKLVNSQDIQQSLAYFLRDNLLCAGFSRLFTDIEQLKPAYVQTNIALTLGMENAPTMWSHKFDDYALDHIVGSCTGDMDFSMICSEKLLKLREHDMIKNTEYFRTLFVYFKCKFNSSEAAKELFIQRSTFFYRMDRIQKLAGLELDSPSELLYLSISLAIMSRVGGNESG